jgi:hypothetical protein
MDKLDTAYGTIEPAIENAIIATQTAGDAATAANDAAAASAEALADFEVESQAAIDSLDTDAIISTIVTEGFTLDINGGSA